MQALALNEKEAVNVEYIPGIEEAMQTLVLTLDLIGTFAFALSGAAAGVKRNLDIFGVLVLSFAAACSGGIIRDVLIGATPPAALSDLRYLAASLVAGLIVFFRESDVARQRKIVILFDAVGLALFAVAGAQKALASGLSPVFSTLLGVMTGIGGGVVVDVLLTNVPRVLRREIYAVAALLGAGVVVLGHELELPSIPIAIAGAALCFGLRLIAVYREWQLPTASAQKSSRS